MNYMGRGGKGDVTASKTSPSKNLRLFHRRSGYRASRVYSIAGALAVFALSGFGVEMGVVLFDTHAFVKRLTAVGMPEAQAEVLADEQARLIDERLATKADLAQLANKAELAAVESSLRTALAETERGLRTALAETDSALRTALAKTDGALRTALAETDGALRTALAESKADIVKWIVGATGLQTLVLLGAIVALAKALH